MKKPFLLLALIIAGVMLSAPVFAAEEESSEQSAPASDDVVVMCEDKYSADSYPDEDERNKLIDTCIGDNSSDNAKPATMDES